MGRIFEKYEIYGSLYHFVMSYSFDQSGISSKFVVFEIHGVNCSVYFTLFRSLTNSLR